VFPLALANLGSPVASIWHSGGLLPTHLHQTTWVLLPCLGFLPTNIWGIHRLILDGILHSLDYNDISVTALAPFAAWLTSAHLDQLVPLKSSFQITQGATSYPLTHAPTADAPTYLSHTLFDLIRNTCNGGSTLLSCSNASLSVAGCGLKRRTGDSETGVDSKFAKICNSVPPKSKTKDEKEIEEKEEEPANDALVKTLVELADDKAPFNVLDKAIKAQDLASLLALFHQTEESEAFEAEDSNNKYILPPLIRTDDP
jgi:hypothetical protein